MEDEYHEPIWLRGWRDPSGVLKAAIEEGRTVDNAEINVTECFEEDPEAAERILTQVSQLVGLRSFRLLPDRFNKIYTVPVHVLTRVLQEAHGLEMFSICALDLVAAAEEVDFAVWMSALRTHPSLKLVRLIRCRFPESQHLLLEELILSLSEIANLKEVELCAAEVNAMGTLSNDSLAVLYQSPFLDKIRLDNFELLEEQHVLPLLNSLMNQDNQNNNGSRLKGIVLSSCQLTSAGLYAIAQVLGSNQTLEEFSICLNNFNNGNSSSDTNNTTIYDDDCFIQIAHQLERNSSLRHLRLTGTNGWPKLNATSQNAFLQMLSTHNCTLETLSLFDRADLQREIDFFLALNRMGRKHVVEENATKEDWLNVVINSQVDLNCLFYFLSMKPQLLE